MTAEHEKTTCHPVPERLLDASKNPVPHVNSIEKYKAMWTESVEKPEQFFGNVRINNKNKKRTIY
jgi:acetyl-CoA synthetase